MKIQVPLVCFFALACIRLSGTSSLASDPTPFEVVQSFSGAWTIKAGDKTFPFHMTYDIGSNGTIVTEQFGKELSVFYRDGDSLVMTHFCNRGNQPRLKLKSGSPAGRFEFEMFDITNLKVSTDAHVQKIIYEILDPQRMNLEIVWRKDAAEESEKYTLIKLP